MVQSRETLSMDNNAVEIPGMYDPLTELYNKPLFIQVMESLLRISMRQHMPVSLAIVNINNYDDLLDEHSLTEVRNMLKECAEIIKSVSRDSDVLAHFEENQFALVLYNCDSKSADIPSQRLRSAIEGKLSIEEQPVTINIGLSTFGEEHNAGRGLTVQQISGSLISRALQALGITTSNPPPMKIIN